MMDLAEKIEFIRKVYNSLGRVLIQVMDQQAMMQRPYTLEKQSNERPVKVIGGVYDAIVTYDWTQETPGN